MNKINRIKGTQDILPETAAHWNYIESIVREKMELFHYGEIRTPVFEKTELFARGIGEATDIVSKEMYTFTDRGKKSLTLKPEMTAPVIRAFIEHNLLSKLPLHKIYYLAPLFRQENPQAGRLRQFHQFGAEAIGSSSPVLDAELIILAISIIKALGIEKIDLKLNSVGTVESRNIYRERLSTYIEPLLNKYCPDCQKRFHSNILRILDCKNLQCIELNKSAPKLLENLDEHSNHHFDMVKDLLKAENIDFILDPYLVRGLDYYTHTVFELTSTSLGSQDAVCGGGRYDLLSKQLGGPDVPAVGFASGIERLIMILEAQNLLPQSENKLQIYLAPIGEKTVPVAAHWLQKLRNAGFISDMDFLGRSIKAQMREANKLNARVVLILGENEMQMQSFSVKDMRSGEQKNVKFDALEDYLKEILESNA